MNKEISDKELLDWVDNQISDYNELLDKEENPYGRWDSVNTILCNRYKYDIAILEKIKEKLTDKAKIISISPSLVLTQEEIDRQELQNSTRQIYHEIKYVCKCESSDSVNEFIKLVLDSDSGVCIDLHPFPKGTRFKNMELYTKYTLPELRVYCPYGIIYTDGD